MITQVTSTPIGPSTTLDHRRTRPDPSRVASEPPGTCRTHLPHARAEAHRSSYETAREIAYPTPHVPPLPPDPRGARSRPRPDRLHPVRRPAHAPGDLRALNALVRRVDRGRDRVDWARVRGFEAATDLVVQVEGAGGAPQGAGHRLPRP